MQPSFLCFIDLLVARASQAKGKRTYFEHDVSIERARLAPTVVQQGGTGSGGAQAAVKDGRWSEGANVKKRDIRTVIGTQTEAERQGG